METLLMLIHLTLLTFSISGTDAALFTIDADDGEVRLKSADFETKNTYNFNIMSY